MAAARLPSPFADLGVPDPAGTVATTAAQSQLTTLLSALVGRSVVSLTQAERLQMLVGIAVAIGAVDMETLTVRPLTSWLIS